MKIKTPISESSIELIRTYYNASRALKNLPAVDVDSISDAQIISEAQPYADAIDNAVTMTAAYLDGSFSLNMREALVAFAWDTGLSGLEEVLSYTVDEIPEAMLNYSSSSTISAKLEAIYELAETEDSSTDDDDSGDTGTDTDDDDDSTGTGTDTGDVDDSGDTGTDTDDDDDSTGTGTDTGTDTDDDDDTDTSSGFDVTIDGETTNYTDADEAFDAIVTAANEGSETLSIILNEDATISTQKKITTDSSLTIGDADDSTLRYITMSEDNSYTSNRQMFYLTSVNPGTINNVCIDASSTCRGIYVGKIASVVFNNVTIRNCVENYDYVAGLYLSSSGDVVLNDVTIQGNTNAKYTDPTVSSLYYSSDLWVGANATCTVNSGTIGNVFVNSNSYSASNKGYITMNGGSIDALYLEYDKGYGSDLYFNDGEIGTLIINNTSGEVTLSGDELVKGTHYYGGMYDETTDEESDSE